MRKLGKQATATKLKVGVWIALAVLAAGTVDAEAGPALRRTPILVFESHTGERPEEAVPLITSLGDELEKRGFAARPTTILQLASGLPRPGILDKDKTATQISQEVEDGYDLFVRGSYAEAVATLRRAIDSIHRNPALIVLNSSNSDAVVKAYTTLALSQAKIGDAEASLTMMQAIRIFPTRPFPSIDYGPEDEKFYRKVYKQIQMMGRGRLLISARNRQAVVYVEGQTRGINKVSLADLIPGTYHVFIQVPGTPGRQYEIDVTANDDSVLNAEPEIDSSLWVTDSWIGFLGARDNEAKFASVTATRWSGRDLIGVVGTMRRAGRLVLSGTIYTTDGTMLRRMMVDVQTATPAVLQHLARMMAEGGLPTDGITLVGAGVTETRDDVTHVPWWRRSSPYLLGGAVAMLASTAVYVRAPRYDHTNSSMRTDYQTGGVYVFMGGSVVLGGGVYLWLRDERRTTAFTAAAIGGGITAILSGAMLYATDEDDGPFAPPRIRDTAQAGVVTGIAGVAVTSAGLLLLWRDRRSPIVPTAAVGNHHGLLSVSGSF